MYKCNDGYRPSKQMISNCTSTGHWTPAPEQHSCTLVEGLRILFEKFVRIM